MTSDHELSQRIEYVRSLLELFAVALERQAPRRQSLEGVAKMIDGIRKTVWEILISHEDYRTSLPQFRLRRATETCRGILSDIESGGLEKYGSTMQQITTTLQDLARAMSVSKQSARRAEPDAQGMGSDVG
ncbi:MAG: hypothetical protein JSW71_13260 [Gemmatimonadota bacterium]|nr:MAG: hypothetical protein JSW71_13260 [Gemmatimonadota bacterium]